MVGILYCQKSKLQHTAIEHLLSTHGIPACSMDIETIDADSLSGCSILINLMGNYYAEEKISLITDFFRHGKNIIHLGTMPFTKDIVDESRNNRVLRSFGIVDDFVPITASSTYVETPDGDTCFASLTGLAGAIYHLCESVNNENVRRAYLEHILDAYDSDGTLIAAPVIRVVTHDQGSMTFFNFNFDSSMLQEEFWSRLIIKVVKKELSGNLLVTVDSAYARYNPQEEKIIRIHVQNINYKKDKVNLSLRILDEAQAVVYEQTVNIGTFPYEVTVRPFITSSALYKIEVTATNDDVIIAKKETGFLVISQEEIAGELTAFHPMYIDETVSGDYCLKDGKITAILGTTHFVTDVYRECFYSMNAWLCEKELALLEADGFNVLRSGNWVHTPAFYREDGSISTRGIRALQSYFLLAARHGFTVQFALGTVLLNQWDRSRSPIHDEDMRQKCMTLIRSFIENFKDYPNVTLDIVNEPSYSIKGAWSPGRPSYEAGELTRYREWLKEKYGTIEALRKAWGETSIVLKGFEDVAMPDLDLFSRGLCRTEQRKNHMPLTDFFTFAREEFSGWTAEIRNIAKEIAPDMLVTMGRDETLRIPLQQDEVLSGNIDMVCWHQWNYNSNILNEYLLNRVRGKICVAQEMGMYRFDDIISGKRHTDTETAATLNKKLLYANGNFVQWQAHDDPFMYELSENSLGIYRADMTPTPGATSTRALVRAERNMQHLMYGREYDKTTILSVYNMSYYYSVDNSLAHQGIKNHICALYNHMHEQADFLPEHLFTAKNASAIGSPKLIILPSMQMLSPDVWEELLTYVKAGTVLLINGCIDKEEHFLDNAKIKVLDSSYTTRKLLNFEKIKIQDNEYVLDFRPVVGHADVTNLLNCGQIGSVSTNRIVEYMVGQGTILYCPYPVELSTNIEATCALYRYAIEKADASNRVYKVLNAAPQIVFTANSYKACTVYTLINEGFADTLSFIDLRSDKTFSIDLQENQGCKLWLDAAGDILQVYGDATIKY